MLDGRRYNWKVWQIWYIFASEGLSLSVPKGMGKYNMREVNSMAQNNTLTAADIAMLKSKLANASALSRSDKQSKASTRRVAVTYYTR